MTAVYDIVAGQGVTFIREFAWQAADGTPVDLVDLVAFGMQVRARPADSDGGADPLLDLTLADVTVDGPGGSFVIEVAADRMGFPAGRYCYDIELTFDDGLVIGLVGGEFRLMPEVTR